MPRLRKTRRNLVRKFKTFGEQARRKLGSRAAAAASIKKARQAGMSTRIRDVTLFPHRKVK